MMHPNANNSPFIKLLLMTTLLMSLGSHVLGLPNSLYMMTWSMINMKSASLNMTLLMDTMSCTFSSTVIFISMNIFLFSQFYMGSEIHKSRFNQMVLLFILSMNMFIYSGDLVFMLVGWDGLGMSSFLLVIYYQNQKSLGGGMVTLMTNRLGDSLLLLALAGMMTGASWNIMFNYWAYTPVVVILLLLFSMMTKSAQLPFSVWLPEAMAAPTPVSSLVHSSTLVTAGIFFMIRLNKLIIYNNLQTMLLFISSMTMVMAGIWGTISKDTKKIVAFSTLSHLGIMMLSLSIGYIALAYMHLLMHAMFKALLFITIGVDMMMKNHKQNHLPNLSSLYCQFIGKSKLISLLSMSALPFLSGYISKDSIIESSLMEEKMEATTMLYLGGSLTVLYSARLWMLASKEFNPSLSTSNYTLMKSFLWLIIPTYLLGVSSIHMGTTLYSLSTYEQPIISLYEHNSIYLILFMGTSIYTMSISIIPSSFLNSLMLQKSVTKKFINPMMNITKLTMFKIEEGIVQWGVAHLFKPLVMLLTSHMLSQQALSPTNLLLISIMSFIMVTSL